MKNITELNVLVTGATGFIGKHLIHFLQKQPEIRIWGISKRGGRVGDVRIDSIDLTIGTDLDDWKKDKPPFDAIFHLAAVVPGSFEGASARESFLANILMVQNILALANRERTTFINISGSSVYGMQAIPPMVEEILACPDNYYSLGKYVCELLCALEGTQKGFITTSLRISAPYGPGQQARTVINLFLDAALASRDVLFYGSGARMQDFTYIDDVVRAMWLAYQEKVSGVFNIASGRSVNMKELAEIVLGLVPATRSRVKPAGKPDPQEAYRGVFSIAKAEQELGYHPQVPLEAGLWACLLARQGAV
ncbi:MAG: NAD-dependent epimerase/dehydratase family protein [Chloroflexota bacterium]